MHATHACDVRHMDLACLQAYDAQLYALCDRELMLMATRRSLTQDEASARRAHRVVERVKQHVHPAVSMTPAQLARVTLRGASHMPTVASSMGVNFRCDV
jgi:hypothetical protein